MALQIQTYDEVATQQKDCPKNYMKVDPTHIVVLRQTCTITVSKLVPSQPGVFLGRVFGKLVIVKA